MHEAAPFDVGASSLFRFFSHPDGCLTDIGFDDFHHVAPILVPRYQAHSTLHLVLSGSGTLEIGEQSYAVAEDDLFFVPTGVSFRYYPTVGDEWRYAWFGVSGEGERWLRESGFSVSRPVLRADASQKAKARVLDMLCRCREDTVADYLYAKGVFLSLLADLAAVYGTARDMGQKERTVSNDRVTDTLISLIDANFQNPALTVEMLCKIVHLSHPYVCKLFRRATGHTVKTEIMERRMREARRLLMTDMRVRDVAEAVGYSDAAHFSKEFHQAYGCSPKRIKQKSKEEA